MMHDAQYAGALLLKPDLWWANQLDPADLTDAPSRKVVMAIRDMLREGEEIDLVLVAERAGVSLQVVTDLTRNCGSLVIAPHAKRIQEAARRRRTAAALRDALAVIDDGGDPSEAMQRAQDAAREVDSTGSIHIAEAVEEWQKRRTEKRELALVTQIPMLNDKLRIEGGRLITVAGRPGCFKSAFALHAARFSALRRHPVGIVSLEMSAAEVGYRWEQQGHGQDPDKLAECRKAPVWIDYTTHDLDGIESRIIEWHERHGITAVVIDYLGLINCTGSKNMRRDEVIGLITRRLKLLAMRLDIAVVLVAQLNRESEKQNRRPILSDLRESGNIEQDSDAVLFLHQNSKTEVWELILAKNRNGPTGMADLQIDKEHFRVNEAAR